MLAVSDDITVSLLISVMPRKKHFADCEIHTLIAKYNENKDVLNSKLKTFVTAAKKKATWNKIVEAINVLGIHTRSVTEIKHKWQKKARKDFA